MISLQKAITDAYKPRPIISVSEWADTNRMLTSTSSAEPGPWRTNRFPYLRPIMDALGYTSPVQEIIVMKGAQLGLTEAGLNWLGYIIDIAPSSTLLVMPHKDDLKKNSIMRISPLLTDTPSLRGKVSAASAKTGENNTFMKVFPGGILNMSSSESSSGLASTPVSNLMMDEIDRYPNNVAGEGSPISLAQKRTATFRNRKIYKISTPTIAGVSLIEKEYNKGDKRKYFCPCVYCGSLITFEFEYMRWEVESDGKTPKNVHLECPDCGGKIENHHKTQMLENGDFIPTNKNHKNPLIISFHLSSLYSPHGFYSWEQMILEYIDAQGDIDKEISFINTVLGLPSTIKSDRVAWADIRDKAEDYNIGIPPKNVIFLTAGVDVQHDRLECEVVGWGLNNESWSIDYIKIYGSPVNRETWLELDKILDREFIREDGAELKIMRMCIDSGYLSNHVYNYVRVKPSNKVHATKGRAKQLRLYDGPVIIDKDSQGNPIQGVNIYHLGVDGLKTEIFNLLKMQRDEKGKYPRGYCHFPKGYEETYFMGLASEEQQLLKDRNGYEKTQWVKKYPRNEPLDCRNYARAAAAIMGYDRMKEDYLLEIEAQNLKSKNKIVSSSGPRRSRFSDDRNDFWN